MGHAQRLARRPGLETPDRVAEAAEASRVKVLVHQSAVPSRNARSRNPSGTTARSTTSKLERVGKGHETKAMVSPAEVVRRRIQDAAWSGAFPVLSGNACLAKDH